MPTEVISLRGSVLEGVDPVVVAAVDTPDGTNLVQGDLTGVANAQIIFSIFDRNADAPATALATGTLDETAVIFDTLQTDGYWGLDGVGYNFRSSFATASFPDGGGSYRIEIHGVTTSFNIVKWVAFVDIIEALAA